MGKHEVLSDGATRRISDTNPVPSPYESSNEATNSVSAGKGKKVTMAPVAVVGSQFKFWMGIEMGFESKGMTVNVKGRAAGGLPPEKRTLKLPQVNLR